MGTHVKVPYFSQHDGDIPEQWQHRACGVVSLYMALSAMAKDVPEPARLIEEGLKIDAYHEGLGWRHDGLVVLANRHGASAFRKEFKEEGEFKKGIEAFKESIKNGGVPIISITNTQNTHLVPLVGFNDEGFFYHEPEEKPETSNAQNQFMSIGEFEKRWRRLAIFVERT